MSGDPKRETNKEDKRSRVQEPVPGAQGLSKALSLMQVITDSAEPLRFNDLLRVSGLTKPTLHRTLRALSDYDMVRLNETDQTYRLGLRVFEMAHTVWARFDLRGSAAPELERLRQITQEAVYLSVFDDGCTIIIDQVDAEHPMRLTQRVGSKVPFHSNALGKALIARQDIQTIEASLSVDALEQCTPRTIVSPSDFRKHLDLIQARGYAISLEEQFLGVSSVAAPIIDHQGVALGAIGIAGASFRLTEERLHSIARDVIVSARRISGNLGEAHMSISVTRRPIVPQSPNLSLLTPSADFLGEAPLWLGAESKLVWLDILKPSLNSTGADEPDANHLELPEMTTSLCPSNKGGFVCTTQSSFSRIDTKTGKLEPIAEPPIPMDGCRFNDGKCDARGRYWAGTLALDASPGQGVLMRLDPDTNKVTAVDDGFHICNGIDWSPDNRFMYLVDSGSRVIYRYSFDLVTGSVSNREEFYKHISNGTPDGITVDADGYIWCAIWDGWQVIRLSPEGEIERAVDLPVPRPTSCVFGGEDLSVLYITSARIRLAATQLAEAPASGGVFALSTEVVGREAFAYGG